MLQFMGLQRVGHGLVTEQHIDTMHISYQVSFLVLFSE